MQDSIGPPAALKGRRLFVKAKCPARIGHACGVALQGLLKRGHAATTKRVFKVGKGKSKRIALKVKPKARDRLAPRKKLLFKLTIKAGGAQATLYRHLKLIRR